MPEVQPLHRPCAHCPFRRDIAPYISAGKAQSIIESLQAGQSFVCHETICCVNPTRRLHCAGALIIMQKSGVANTWVQLCQRLGFDDLEKLDMDAPVYASLDEFVQRHREADA